ncbi:MAG: hypothetical protein LBD82_07600, partial [Deltaproteobacteria bacterium]|nr:hypothetical protein [Deltaproteobacteria bacterium]
MTMPRLPFIKSFFSPPEHAPRPRPSFRVLALGLLLTLTSLLVVEALHLPEETQAEENELEAARL